MTESLEGPEDQCCRFEEPRRPAIEEPEQIELKFLNQTPWSYLSF